jgi:hypothetical protein
LLSLAEAQQKIVYGHIASLFSLQIRPKFLILKNETEERWQENAPLGF